MKTVKLNSAQLNYLQALIEQQLRVLQHHAIDSETETCRELLPLLIAANGLPDKNGE